MKTYVIALTTFREIVRRPLFWLLIGVAAFLLGLFVIIPYHTFGEDIKMVKDQGLAVIMVTGMIVALLAASVSISEEIEGKTAITLLSKPINRRAFIIGKFSGIMWAIAVLFGVLSLVFALALISKVFYDSHVNVENPTWLDAFGNVWQILPGIVLTYFQVTILCALSVAFSTRFPLHLNISACIVIYLLGHLAPQMVQASSQGQKQFEAVVFLAKFFKTILPGLEYFNITPAISAEVPVPWLDYVLPCFGYCVLYTSILLLLALLMFEDRDLA